MAHFLSQPRIDGPIYLGPGDISFLRAQISEAESQVESLEKGLKRLYEEPKISELELELERRKKEKLVEIASFRNILSPIRRAPQELLSEIFELSCVLEGSWKSELDTVHRTSALCRVCIAWRKAAHSTPRLWSKFSLHRIRGNSGKFEWVREWLSRSQTLPLDVYLCIDIPHCEASSTTEILKHVFFFHHRIRLLDFHCTRARYRSDLPFFISSSFSKLSFPLLEVISIKCDAVFPRWCTSDRISMMLIDVPELRHVNIAFDNSTIVKQLSLPVEQLNSLKICHLDSQFDPAVYVDLLPRCKVLVHLDICWPDLSGRFPTFLLPTLKSLRVSCHQVDSHGTSLLSCFTSSLLEELTLYHYGQNVHQLFANLVRFQRRSATALSTLTLQYFRARHGQLKPEDWTAALSLSREIKALHLETCSFNVDPLLQALTYTKEHHNLLPKLTNFTLHYDFLPGEDEGLIAMILSRWWPDVDESELNHGVDLDSQMAFDRSGLQRLQKVSLRALGKREIKSLSGLAGLDVKIWY